MMARYPNISGASGAAGLLRALGHGVLELADPGAFVG
jgi:hypothetical protein